MGKYSDISLIEKRTLPNGYVIRIENDDWGKYIRIENDVGEQVFGKLIVKEKELELEIKEAIANL